MVHVPIRGGVGGRLGRHFRGTGEAWGCHITVSIVVCTGRGWEVRSVI